MERRGAKWWNELWDDRTLTSVVQVLPVDNTSKEDDESSNCRSVLLGEVKALSEQVAGHGGAMEKKRRLEDFGARSRLSSETFLHVGCFRSADAEGKWCWSLHGDTD